MSNFNWTLASLAMVAACWTPCPFMDGGTHAFASLVVSTFAVGIAFRCVVDGLAEACGAMPGSCPKTSDGDLD